MPHSTVLEYLASLMDKPAVGRLIRCWEMEAMSKDSTSWLPKMSSSLKTITKTFPYGCHFIRFTAENSMICLIKETSYMHGKMQRTTSTL